MASFTLSVLADKREGTVSAEKKSWQVIYVRSAGVRKIGIVSLFMTMVIIITVVEKIFTLRQEGIVKEDVWEIVIMGPDMKLSKNLMKFWRQPWRGGNAALSRT